MASVPDLQIILSKCRLCEVQKKNEKANCPNRAKIIKLPKNSANVS